MSTWMVVEDEPDIYDVLLAMFEVWGIEGIAFVDGAEAVNWIEDVDKGTVTGELPELAILDIRLPEISGPEVGARLRQSSRLGEIAIVLITAYRLSAEEEQKVQARAQADALMYKPLPEMMELRRRLAEIISRRQPEAALLKSAGPAVKSALPVASSVTASPRPPHEDPWRLEAFGADVPQSAKEKPHTEPLKPEPRQPEAPKVETPTLERSQPEPKPGKSTGGMSHAPRTPPSDPYRP